MDAFPSHVVFVLAGLKILSGLTLALFGSLAVLARAAGHELFVGVWAGTATLVSSILALAMAKNRSVYSISFTMMNGVALVTSVSAAVLAANALVVDAGHFGELDFAAEAVAISIRQKERVMVIDFVLTIFSALDTLLSAVCVVLGLRQISLNNKGSMMGSESLLSSNELMSGLRRRRPLAMPQSPLMLNPMWPRPAFQQRYPTAKMATRSNSMCSRRQVAIVPLVYYWPNNNYSAFSVPQYTLNHPHLVPVHRGSSRILANLHGKRGFANSDKNCGRLRRHVSLCDRDLDEQFVDHTLNKQGNRVGNRRSNSRVNSYYNYFGNNKNAECNNDDGSNSARERNRSNNEDATW